MTAQQKRVITPNAARRQRAVLRGLVHDYSAARRNVLALKAAGWRSPIAREDAISKALEARYWLRGARQRIAETAVEVGAAWSPRALVNVRSANARRHS